jgi:hypothetical protein
VAERTGTSSDTVARVKREDDVTSVDDAREHRHRRIGRPSKATPFAPRVGAARSPLPIARKLVRSPPPRTEARPGASGLEPLR